MRCTCKQEYLPPLYNFVIWPGEGCLWQGLSEKSWDAARSAHFARLFGRPQLDTRHCSGVPSAAHRHGGFQENLWPQIHGLVSGPQGAPGIFQKKRWSRTNLDKTTTRKRRVCCRCKLRLKCAVKEKCVHVVLQSDSLSCFFLCVTKTYQDSAPWFCLKLANFRG